MCSNLQFQENFPGSTQKENILYCWNLKKLLSTVAPSGGFNFNVIAYVIRTDSIPGMAHYEVDPAPSYLSSMSKIT